MASLIWVLHVGHPHFNQAQMDNVPLSVCCGTNELLSYLTGVPVIIVHSLKNVINNFTTFNSIFYHLPFSSGATSPTSTVDTVVPPPKVPKLLPMVKRSNSTQETTSEPLVPPAIPKLLPVLKRSHSSQGVTEPVAASPPPVKVKQEKPESPMDFSPCQESMQKVCGQLNVKLLLVFVFNCLAHQIEHRIDCRCS